MADDLERHLDSQILFEELIVELQSWTQSSLYAAGETLAVADEPDDGIKLLTSGRASLRDGDGARLHQYGPGDLIEPLGILGASGSGAKASADEPCRIETLTAEAQRLLEARDQRLALRLYRYLLNRPSPNGTQPVQRNGLNERSRSGANAEKSRTLR